MLVEEFQAVVTRLDEESNDGSFYVYCAGLGGDNGEVPVKVESVLPLGLVLYPRVGQLIYITVISDEDAEDGGFDDIKLQWLGKAVITADEVDENVTVNVTPDEFVADYGSVRGFYTDNHKIILDDANNKIIIKDGNNNVITLDENGVKIESDGDVNVENAGNVILGDGATEAAILGDAFKTTYDAHTHPTGMGPSGPPAVLLPANNLSTKVKVNS